MLKRLSDELQSRVSKGSDILVAVADEAESGVEAEGLIDATGQYVEPGLPCVTPRMPPTSIALALSLVDEEHSRVGARMRAGFWARSTCPFRSCS